ncbi:MAG: ABC transporter ATP-binding protein [Anaerolineae bacterium]|nr:ABC transporter ATP-binding protein [Anaerolineae bacterium]
MLLHVDGITKRFGGLVALKNVSLSLGGGEVWGLIGPNGAGKTTLLNVIAGTYKPNAGTIRLNGESITGLSPEKICRKGISRTFQICRPFGKMTVLENVLVAARFGDPGSDTPPPERALAALDFVEFPVPTDTAAGALNASQLRRLDMARALASNPRLLLLDEVAAGLNSTELIELERLIGRIRDRGVTILIVEHLMRLIMSCCERIVVLQHGEWIAEGTPAEILADERVTTAYLGARDG